MENTTNERTPETQTPASDEPRAAAVPPGPVAAWAPMRQPLFRRIWIASFVSNIGTWMQTVAAGWLMTVLEPEPLLVALVQTSTSLAFCLLALPAGALADVVDRRRLLIVTQSWMLVAALALGVLTVAGATTAWVLLAFTFLLAMGTAMTGPAWMAIIPELVPRHELGAAVVLNSVSFNLALAVGPALGGLVVAAVGEGKRGAAAAFLLNAASFLGVIVVLYRWRRPAHGGELPAERMLGALRTGLRYVRHAPPLQIVFLRGTVFILSGSALWALLPLLARQELELSSGGYGMLLACLGAGAVVGAVFLAPWRHRFGIDAVVTGATLLFALVLLALAWVRIVPLLGAAMVLGGVAWLALLGTLMVAAQTVVPSWVRARAMAVFMVVFQGGMAAGSTLWGGVANRVGIPQAFAYAALGLVLGVLLQWRLRLASGEGLDLTPSLHWPRHAGVDDPDPEHGPVLIVVEYRIEPARMAEFSEAMRPVRLCRLRDGASRWGLFQDTADPSRCLETFVVGSWVEHLRQHERMTVADRAAEERARSFHIGPNPPQISHYIAVPVAK